MTMVVRRSTLCCLLSVIAVVALAGNTYVLKRQPKVGETTKYRVKAEFSYKGEAATMSMLQTEKVCRVDDDGAYEVETSSAEAKMFSRGEDRALPDEEPITSRYDRSGAVLKLGASEDPLAYRRANMLSVILPNKEVKVGEEWKRELDATCKCGVPSVSQFQVEAEERVGDTDTVKVKFAYHESGCESPISSEGFAWVKPADGSLVKLEADIQNLPMGATNTPVEGKFTMKLDN